MTKRRVNIPSAKLRAMIKKYTQKLKEKGYSFDRNDVINLQRLEIYSLNELSEHNDRLEKLEKEFGGLFEDDRLYRTADIVRITGLNYNTIYRWIVNGLIMEKVAIKLKTVGSKPYKVKGVDILKFLKKRGKSLPNYRDYI